MVNLMLYPIISPIMFEVPIVIIKYMFLKANLHLKILMRGMYEVRSPLQNWYAMPEILSGVPLYLFYIHAHTFV